MRFFEELWELIRPRLLVAITLVLDSLFFLVWAVIQAFTGYVLSQLALEGTLNDFFLQSFQWVFGGATFLAVLSYLVKDFWLVWKQMTNNSQEEQSLPLNQGEMQPDDKLTRRLSNSPNEKPHDILSEDISIEDKRYDDTV